jgi:hypothetical protein
MDEDNHWKEEYQNAILLNFHFHLFDLIFTMIPFFVHTTCLTYTKKLEKKSSVGQADIGLSHRDRLYLYGLSKHSTSAGKNHGEIPSFKVIHLQEYDCKITRKLEANFIK